jgi:hypothetical protein
MKTDGIASVNFSKALPEKHHPPAFQPAGEKVIAHQISRNGIDP